MLLNELVEINQKGNLRSSVDLGFLDDSDLNRDLCESFIFSFDSQDPKRSTLGILDLVRESFHSANKPNIHLMVQQYGKGKSHFALAVANYFKKGFGSPDVEAILHQAEASSGNDSPIANRLRAYKKNHDQHLVIRLRGDQAGNIRQQFLTELLQSLKEANITDTVAQHFCAEPLKFLQERILPNANHREIAEEYLESQGNEDGGLREIIKALENNNANVVKHAIGITKAVMGITPNFDTEIDIEKILTDIINNHCRGENPDFQGILIIFDELMAYLKNFSQDSQGSGGMALQNITTVCEKNRSHIALISFSPVSLEIATGIPAGQLEDYRKLAGRLSPKAETYNNVPSSLELVLSNIVLQTKNNTLWSEFRQRWDTTLSSQTEMAYTKVMAPAYRNKFSDKSKFHSTVTLGTFPLHPLCTYLLCNIDFAQVVARNSIQFVREYATRFIDSTPAEISGRLNQIYAIEVLKAFHDSFTDSPMYSDYAKARDGIAASATSEELDVLGALFLFYAAGEKLSKADRDPHEPILEALSGIPENKINEIMKRFSKFIYFDSTRRQYRFFEGTSPGDILKRVQVAVAKDISDNPDLPLEKTLSECLGKVTTYLKSDTLYASDFVVNKKQIKQDWGFTYGFYSIESLKREIANKSILDNIRNAKGILAYVLCETPEEHRDLQEEIPILINNADLKVRERVAIAMPKTSIGDVGENILMIKRLTELSSAKADGQAYSNCYEQLTSHVEKELTSLLRNVIVYSHLDHKLTSDVRQNPQGVISELLSDLYPLVPTLEACDKMRTGHITGRKTVMLILKQLFADTFSPHSFKQEDLNIIEPVFIRGWGLFGKIRDIYEVRIPTNAIVRKAWETIDELAGLGVWSERYISLKVIWQKLSEPPYGYSDMAFVVLLAAWLHHHRYEISIKGTLDPKKASIKQEMSLKQWANTELVNSKPDILVGKWIEVQDAQIYRTKVKSLADLPTAPMPFSVAQDYLKILQDFLSNEDIDPKQRQEVQTRFDNLSKQLDPYVIWLEPVLAIEELQRTALYAFTRLIDLKHAIDSRQLPPAPRLGDPYAIQRTENEVQRHDNAKSWLESTIQFEIDKHLGSLDTVIDPGNIVAFQSQTEKMLGDIQELHQFPPTWIQVLEQGITAAQIKEADLKKTAELINAKAQIQDLCGMHSRSTEDDYKNAIEKIQAIGEKNPVVREERIYQDSLDGLESCLSLLSSQIIRWRQQSYELNHTEALLTLSREIASHKSRYKKSEHLEIIRQVEEQVKQKIVAGNTQDKKREAEENIYQLEQKVGQVYTLVERERPKAADRILTELKRLDYQYADVITNGFLPRLEEIKKVCQQELDKDVAAKIKLDFQKLPPSIRQQLIQELTQLSQV